jgi:hypothetical protein
MYRFNIAEKDIFELLIVVKVTEPNGIRMYETCD